MAQDFLSRSSTYTFFRWAWLFLGMKLAFRFIKISGNSSYNSYTFAHILCSFFTAARKGMIRSLLFSFLHQFRMYLILEFEFLMLFLRHLSSLWSPANSYINARVKKHFVLHVLSSWIPTREARVSGEFHWHFYVRLDIHARFSFYYCVEESTAPWNSALCEGPIIHPPDDKTNEY